MASCDPDEVIAMELAHYGRMRLGRCVKGDLGYIGCSADVLDVTDRKCSGRHRCEIRIPNEEFERTKPCYMELKSYFEAQYHCVKGKCLSYIPYKGPFSSRGCPFAAYIYISAVGGGHQVIVHF